MSATAFEVHHKRTRISKPSKCTRTTFPKSIFSARLGNVHHRRLQIRLAPRRRAYYTAKQAPPTRHKGLRRNLRTLRFVAESTLFKAYFNRKTDLNTCFLQASAHNAFLVRNGVISDKIRHGLDAVAHSQDDAFGSDVENEERIKALLVILGQYFLQNADDFAFYGKNNPCVTKAIDYISEHITEDLSLDTIASALLWTNTICARFQRKHQHFPSPLYPQKTPCAFKTVYRTRLPRHRGLHQMRIFRLHALFPRLQKRIRHHPEAVLRLDKSSIITINFMRIFKTLKHYITLPNR